MRQLLLWGEQDLEEIKDILRDFMASYENKFDKIKDNPYNIIHYIIRLLSVNMLLPGS